MTKPISVYHPKAVYTWKKLRNHIGLALLNLLFVGICFVVLLPILYALSISFNANNSILGSDFTFIPREFTLANYRSVIVDQPILLWFSNTLILAVSSVLIALGVAIPGAYSMSRRRFRGRVALTKTLILLHSFPAILSMFAIFRVFSPLGLVNSRLGLTIIYIGTMSIFGLLNLKGYFDSIPQEIEEAAKMDGTTTRQTIQLIFLPLAKPAIVVTAIMVLIYVWNEYIFAITFMTGRQNYTLAAGLYSLQATEMSGNWPIFAAASIVVSIPILIIFFASQKYMVSGLTAGGVKG